MNGVPDHVASPAEVRAMIDRYVDELKAAAAFESAAVERALRRVERHRLLETFYFRTAGERQTIEHDPGHPRRDHLALIYADTALATRHIDGLPASSTSQASLVARMLELLEVGEGMKILEVGAGTGYNAAFMPVRGPLYIEKQWAVGACVADPADVVCEPDPGPRFSARPPGEPMQLTDDEIDFLFFLGLEDDRACWTLDGPALSAGPDGWAALAPGGISWWKDASLARELDRRYREWAARGRPAMEDYQITFWPVGAGSDPPPGGWQIQRRFYRQLLELTAGG